MNFYESADKTLVRRFNVPDSIFFMITCGKDTSNFRLIIGSTNGHLY
jgi:hypothetical protein